MRTLYRAWDVLVAVSATLSAVIIPLRLVVGVHDAAVAVRFDEVITLIFSLDVLFHVRRSQSEGGQPAFQSLRGSGGYSPAWLIVDLLAAAPSAAILGVPFLNSLRLLKLARVAQFMHEWRHYAVKIRNVLRLVFFGYWLLLSAHWIGCIWLALRGIPAAGDWLTGYIGALYWAIQTLSSVGYGDVTPVTRAQTLYAIVVMLVGVGVYGYVIGTAASLLTNIDPARTHYLETMEKVQAFMNYRDIPHALQKRIRDYYAYLWEKRLGYEEATVLSGLPPSLSTDVSLFLKRDIIHKVPMFRDAGDQFVRDVALRMHPVVFTPGDYVCMAGEPGRDMYFISQGRLDVVSRDGRTVLATLTDGDFFGEMSLVFDQPRTACVRAATYCDLYRLDKESFDYVLSHCPQIAAQIQAKARGRQADAGQTG